MINTDFLIVSYLVGLFVDWVVQSDWQASHKSKWDKSDNKWLSFIAVTSHACIYALLTSTIVYVLVPGLQMQAKYIYLVLFITHAIIDTRIPVKWVMKLKGMKNIQINDYVNYGFMHIGIDHRLHEMVLLLLALWV